MSPGSRAREGNPGALRSPKPLWSGTCPWAGDGHTRQARDLGVWQLG